MKWEAAAGMTTMATRFQGRALGGGADGFDRLHARGLERRVDAVQDAEHDRDSDGDDHAADTHRQALREEAGGRRRDADPSRGSEHAADDRQENQLAEELDEDLGVGRSERLAQTDLVETLPDRDQQHGKQTEAPDEK